MDMTCVHVPCWHDAVMASDLPIQTLAARSTRVDRAIRALVLFGIGAVWVWGALALIDSSMIADSTRDTVAAARLLVDGQWPAEGPGLYETWVLSPLWLWLFSGLVALLPNLVFVYVAIGALSMGKLILAWRIGQRVENPMFAPCFALLMMWPGWSFIEAVVVTHTNLVQVTGLLFALAALRAREQPNLMRAVLMSAAFALALAMHPTNLALAPLLLLPLAGRVGFARSAVYAVVGVGIVLLSLVPTALHEYLSSGASASFLERMPEPGWLQRWPRILAALLIDSQGSPLQQVALVAPEAARLLSVAFFVLVALAALGWLLPPRGTRHTQWALLAWLILWTGCLAILRPTTPIWMALSAQPMAYAVLAFGLASLLAWFMAPLRFVVFALLLGCAVAAAASFASARIEGARLGIERHAVGRVVDISAGTDAAMDRSPRLPPRSQEALVSWACHSTRRKVIVGDGAVLAMGMQGAVLKLRHCPPARWPLFGAGPPGATFALVPESFAQQLALAGTRVGSFRAIAVARVVAPRDSRRQTFNPRYPPYGAADVAPAPLRVETRLAGNQVLVVTALLAGFMRPDVQLAVGESVLAPVADSGSSLYFQCPGRQECVVSGTAAAGAPYTLQVFVLTARERSGS